MAVNHTLQIDEFAEQPEQLPVHIDYHEYTADQSSRAGCSFRVDSPGSGALMDSEAWIIYTVRLTSAAGGLAFETMFRALNSSITQTNQQRGVKIALRQGFTMQRAMQSISVNINGTTLVERPDRYTDQVLRFYTMPQEAETIMTGSGGYLDDGFGYALTEADNPSFKSAGAVAQVLSIQPFPGFASNAANTVASNSVPDSSYFINKGFSKRHQKFMRFLREAGTPNVITDGSGVANVAYPAALTLTLRERLPISPFMNYEARDLKRSIPHVNQMTVNINWNANMHQDRSLNSMIFQGHDAIAGGTIFQFLEVNWFQTPPVLHLKWIIPPMGYRLPPQISIPIIDYQHFSQEFATLNLDNNASSRDTAQLTFNNIRLEQIPDYLFIYLVPEQSASAISHPSEFSLEIKSLDISTDGDAGKMLSATSIELYSMYVRNALGREMIRSDYEQWRKHHCVVVLRPEDMGLRYSPGIRNPVTLNIRCQAAIHWNRPQYSLPDDSLGAAASSRFHNGNNLWGAAAGRLINWNILCEYRKYRLTLTESGGSRRELLSLPKSDVQSLPQAVPAAAVGGLQGVF